MILEDATYEAYGYYSTDLSHGSGKPIKVACDECGNVRTTSKHGYHALCKSCAPKDNTHALGLKHTEEHKAKICATLTGKNNPNFGKHLTEEHKAKIRKALKGKYVDKNNPNFGTHRTEESKMLMSITHKGKCLGAKHHNYNGGPAKCVCLKCGKTFEVEKYRLKRGKGKYCSSSCAIKAQRYIAKPRMTVPEKRFEIICNKSNLPFKFVGDGALWLGNANPDFVHNTKKIGVEVFGDYWHSPLLNRNIRKIKTLPARRAQLKAEGYKCIIIWESDLKRSDAEKFVMYVMHTEGII